MLYCATQVVPMQIGRRTRTMHNTSDGIRSTHFCRGFGDVMSTVIACAVQMYGQATEFTSLQAISGNRTAFRCTEQRTKARIKHVMFFRILCRLNLICRRTCAQTSSFTLICRRCRCHRHANACMWAIAWLTEFIDVIMRRTSLLVFTSPHDAADFSTQGVSTLLVCVRHEVFTTAKIIGDLNEDIFL